MDVDDILKGTFMLPGAAINVKFEKIPYPPIDLTCLAPKTSVFSIQTSIMMFLYALKDIYLRNLIISDSLVFIIYYFYCHSCIKNLA